MSDAAMNKINEAFNAACYGDFLEHMEKFDGLDDIDEVLARLEPYIFHEIISESTNRQAKLLCEFSEETGLAKIHQRKEIEAILRANFKDLEPRLQAFDEKLSLFRMRLQAWQDESSDDTFSGAFTGAVIGTILAGPLGTIIGGLLGGSGDSSAETDFKREFQSLLSNSESLTKKLKSCLDACLENCDEILKENPEILDDVKLLLPEQVGGIESGHAMS